MTKGATARLSSQFLRSPSLRRSLCPSCLGGHSSVPFAKGRLRTAGLTLIEILIGLFIFLIGILGVLSLFPVAMSTAGKAISETRATILAQSALAQLKSDCTLVYFRGAADTNSGATKTVQLIHAGSLPAAPTSPSGWGTWRGFYITLKSGPGAGQCRRIANYDSGTKTFTVDRAWTAVTVPAAVPPPPNAATWTAPGSPGELGETPPNDLNTRFPNQQFIITRMGLPDVSAPNVLPAFGRDRDLVIWAMSGPDAFIPGIAWNEDATIDPQSSGTSVVLPFTGDSGTVSTADATGNTLICANKAWAPDASFSAYDSLFRHYRVRITSGAGVGQVRRVTANNNNTLQVTPPLSPAPAVGDTFEVGWSGTAAWPVANGYTGAHVMITNGRSSGRVFWLTADSRPAALFTRPSGATPPYNDIDSGLTTAFTATSLTSAGKSWPALANNYAVILRRADPATAPNDTLQVRRITANGANTLTVSPGWNPLPTVARRYEIVPLRTMTCAPAEFDRHGITGAERDGQYRLQDAATFNLLGGNPWLFSVLPKARLDEPRAANKFRPDYTSGTVAVATGSPAVTGTGTAWLQASVGPGDIFTGPDAKTYTIASVAGDTSLTLATGYTGPNSPAGSHSIRFVPRVTPDEFGNAAQQDNYGSDYHYVAILGDGGVTPTDPVRADVIVYRNFNTSRDLTFNQKPVGFATGNIERP